MTAVAAVPDTTVESAKFRLERRCVMPGHGKRGAEPTLGLVCARHAADVRDLMADVHDLLLAYAEGDAINPTRTDGKVSKSPHAPIPIRLNAFLIGNPGGSPTEPADEFERWRRYGNPVTGRLESNGPDAPDIPHLIWWWANELATHDDLITPPAGDTLARLDWLRTSGNLAGLTELDHFGAFLTDMRSCRRALAAAIGEQPGPAPLGKCPDCDMPLFTDLDREVIRRRRANEQVTGEDAKAMTARADRVVCGCGAQWEGPGLLRLKLILEAAR